MRVRLFRDRLRLQRVLEDPLVRQRLRGIVAAGGDGTVCDVFNRFPGIPIAILPCGTENLLARYLELPTTGRGIAETILAGRLRNLDLCIAGERRFALMASAGFDADIVHRTAAARVGHVTRVAYLRQLWHAWRKFSHPRLEVRVDDDPDPVCGRLAILTNLPKYALGLQFAPAARGDDGQADLTVFQRGSAFQMLRYLYKVATVAHEELEDVRIRRGSRFRIGSDIPVPVQMDGDPAGWTPVEIQVLPGALQVFVSSRR
jgi:diacylglycerol kinase family enzyme